MDELWTHIGISPDGALGVAVASALLYVLYSVVLTLWGPRLFSSSSTLSVALLTVLGSLMARAMLGDFPTLGGAIVAAATLLLMEAIIGRLRKVSTPAWAKRATAPRHRPRVVMIEGQFVDRPKRERVTSDADVLLRLRTAGLRHVDDAALVALADATRAAVRAQDLVARVGGEYAALWRKQTRTAAQNPSQLEG